MQTETIATTPRRRVWNMTTVEAGARSRGDSAEDQLLATFDVFHEVFGRADREARAFTDLLAAAAPVEGFTSAITALATDAKLEAVSALVNSWRILAHGSARSFVDGNHDAGLNARQMAGDLIARHRAPLHAYAIDVSLDSTNQNSFDAMEWN